MIGYKEFAKRWSELHGGAEVEGVVAAWLRISYAIVRPLAFLRISPNFLTFLGLASAGVSYPESISLLKNPTQRSLHLKSESAHFLI